MSAQTRSIGDLYSYGTAADKALIDTNNIPPGFRYFETDTGAQYQWNGTAWVGSAFMPTGARVGNSVAAHITGVADDVALAGQQFFGRKFQGAVASEYSLIQFQNPTGSGKTVFIDSIMLISSFGCYLANRSYAMQGTAAAFGNSGSGSLAGTTPALLLYSGSVVTDPGAAALSLVGNRYLEFPAPIVLKENEHVTFYCATVNNSFSIDLMWREV